MGISRCLCVAGLSCSSLDMSESMFMVEILFFILVMRGAQRSTLFPYTTLFRPLRNGGPQPGRAARQVPGQALFPGAVRRDRKRTRLNSSHQIISYAVFCLKKTIVKHFFR